MSLMTSGNAKPDANGRQRNRLLGDPERIKKDLEHERRITRLQQVREKSNSMARQIRQDVAAEKTRQVQKLERTKQKELNVWREHVMAKKHQDYRTSVFQVGAAHRAALVEIEKADQQKQQRAEKMKKCRRLAANSMVKHTPANILRVTGGRDLNAEGRATTGTQTPVQTENDGKENRLNNGKKCKLSHCPDTSKRKHRRCRDNANCRPESSDEVETLSDSSCDDVREQRPSSSSGRKLQKTPPIILDVDIESEDSLENCTRNGIEINDRHIQTNRKFSRVVRPSPTKSPICQQGAVPAETIAPCPRFTLISDLVRRSTQVMENDPVNKQNQLEEQPIITLNSPTRSLHRASTKPTAEAPASSPKRSPIKDTAPASPKQAQTEKRSSLRNSRKQAVQDKVIDAGIKRSTVLSQRVATVAAQPTGMPMSIREPSVEQPRVQQQMPLQEQPIEIPQPPFMQQMPIQPLPPYAPQPMHPNTLYAAPIMQGYPAPILSYPVQTFAMQPMQQYPQQQSSYAAQQQNMPAASTSTSVAPPRPAATHSSVSTTTTTYVVRQKQGTGAETNTTGRVQFYDHNNKYSRNYKAPSQAVQVNLPDATHLNAMDHARIETQLSQLREQELDQLRKVTDQRGQKALQREQVRRDCAELTEKLEALTQQQPQLLPSDSNFVASHRFTDLASRREQKMNEVMEQMLLRPAIVTCPEVVGSGLNSPKKSCGHAKSSAQHAINVGDPPAAKADDAVSSASCCSLLLDYVDDQSKQLRSELKGMHSKSAKSVKLKSLLQRIDKIRAQLLAELKAGDMTGDNAQKVIDSIRKERANINSDMARNLDEREMALQKKEEILEQRLRQLYKQQQKIEGQKQGNDAREIIIKVRSDGTVKQYVPKDKSQSKTNPKPAVDASKPTTSSSTGGSATSAERQQADVELNRRRNVPNQRHNSIDSNSTAYRDLPSVNYENIRASAATTTVQAQPEPLHPIVAHYVQRLLAMSQTTIEQLGVSSSEVPTPTESIINQPHNRSSGATKDETLIDNQRMDRVQAFIQENRSFINELESSLTVQQKQQEQQKQQQQQQQQELANNESSEHAFDQIWMKRFANNKKEQQQQQHQKQQQQNQQQQQLQEQKEPQKKQHPQIQTQRESERSSTTQSGSPTQTRRSVTIARETESTKNTARLPGNQLSNQIVISEATTSSRVKETQVISSSQINKSQSSSEKLSTRKMERYEMLTEKCIQRISDLTELINKVRGEKQRLVEVTLTSASEGDRHSTEYFDLPPMQGLQQQQEERGVRTLSEGSDATQSNSEAMPLQKHKPTGASLDSGISVSRPMTAMGQELPDAEPTSLGSSTQGGSHRRGKVPPATIRRYSPQLAADELAHELSTITEVDTPAQSHIATTSITAPIPFPTFEQYARELQLDVSQMNADQSLRMQHEFHELIQCIKQDIPRLDYRQFPSITAYLYESTATLTRVHMDKHQTEQQSISAAQLMEELRLNDVSIREFPTRHEYLQQLLEREPPDQRDLIDSASLESSDSFNVEAELRKRRLLKSSFRRGHPDDLLELDVASSTRRESFKPNASSNVPSESGIQPLSRSHFERPPGLQRPISMRHKQRQVEQPSRSSSSSSLSEPEQQSRSNGGASNDAPQEVSQIGRSLNLRDFLTKELLKHRAQHVESGSEGTDDSLKSHFLRSVIDSLSQSESPHTPGLGHGTNATNDRQKTSTPVGSLITGQDKSGSLHSSDSQLFSMDSRISAVHYPDGTPPIPYDQQNLSSDKRSTDRISKSNRKPTSAARK